MNEEGAVKHWACIVAFKAGNVVECRWMDEKDGDYVPWEITYRPHFNSDEEYRVKRDPIEIYVNIYPTSVCSHLDKISAEDCHFGNVERIGVKFVEVIDD